MPENITDVSTFTDPIVVPADSDPADRTYVLTLAQGLANRTRRLANLLGGANGSGNWAYPSPRARTTAVPLTSGISGSGAWSWNGSAWSAAGVGNLLWLPIALPFGAELEKIVAVVTPAGVSTFRAGLETIAISGGGLTITPTTTYGSASVGLVREKISYTPGSPVVVDNSANAYNVRIASGTAGDLVEYVWIEWTDPGPRNF